MKQSILMKTKRSINSIMMMLQLLVMLFAMSLSMSSHAQTGNLTITRTPSTMIAGQPFTIAWSSTEPTAVATKYSCVSPSGGFAGSATLTVSGSASGTADPNWLWKDSTCAWTVVNAAGSVLASRTDIMKTVAAPVNGVTYIHTDGLGSPVAKSDANGNLIAGSRTRYEPYGMTVAGTATPTIGFTGHVNDADTGLTYMQQRYYDPVAGRFLSTDPVLTDQNSAAHFNRYTYALNNPYKYVDPDGRLPFLVPVAIFLLKEAAAEVASHYTGGASDFLSVRRSAQNVGGFALKKMAHAVNGAVADLAKHKADSVAAKTKISGNAQNTTLNGQNTTHASTSERIANEMAASGEYSSVHMHQKVSTITNGQLSSGVLPDVAGVRKDNGLIDVTEVLSGRQTPAQMQKKITGALGSQCGTITCVKQD